MLASWRGAPMGWPAKTRPSSIPDWTASGRVVDQRWIPITGSSSSSAAGGDSAGRLWLLTKDNNRQWRNDRRLPGRVRTSDLHL